MNYLRSLYNVFMVINFQALVITETPFSVRFVFDPTVIDHDEFSHCLDSYTVERVMLFFFSVFQVQSRQNDCRRAAEVSDSDSTSFLNRLAMA